MVICLWEIPLANPRRVVLAQSANGMEIRPLRAIPLASRQEPWIPIINRNFKSLKPFVLLILKIGVLLCRPTLRLAHLKKGKKVPLHKSVTFFVALLQFPKLPWLPRDSSEVPWNFLSFGNLRRISLPGVNLFPSFGIRVKTFHNWEFQPREP